MVEYRSRPSPQKSRSSGYRYSSYSPTAGKLPTSPVSGQAHHRIPSRKASSCRNACERAGGMSAKAARCRSRHTFVAYLWKRTRISNQTVATATHEDTPTNITSSLPHRKPHQRWTHRVSGQSYRGLDIALNIDSYDIHLAGIGNNFAKTNTGTVLSCLSYIGLSALT